MVEPRVRFNRATNNGGETLHVDYRDVLEQAIANERFRILREVRAQIERIKVREQDPINSYREKERSADKFRDDIRAALDGIEKLS